MIAVRPRGEPTSRGHRGRQLSGYYRVPRDVVLSPLWRRLTPGQRCVAMVLLSLADYQNSAVTASLAELADLANVHRNVVRNALRALSALGFIVSPSEGTPEAQDRAHHRAQRGTTYLLRNASLFGEGTEEPGPPEGIPEAEDRARGVPPENRGVPPENRSPYMEKKRTEKSLPPQEALTRADSLRQAVVTWKADHRLARGFSEATRTAWAVELDRLSRVDGVSWARIDAVIAWLPSSDFWAPNVQSADKLRKQFDRLEAETRKRRGLARATNQTAEEMAQQCLDLGVDFADASGGQP